MSLFGGLGIQSLNTLTPAALGAQQRAIDSLLAVNEAGLSRQHDSQERKKDRDAQEKAKAKARKDANMRMGIGIGAGVIGGAVGGLALAPAAIGASAGGAAAGTAAGTAAGAGAAGATAGSVGSLAAAPVAGTLAGTMPGATIGGAASSIADAAIAAPSMASAQGIIGAGSTALAPSFGAAAPAAASGGLGIGGSAAFGGAVGSQTGNFQQPQMPQPPMAMQSPFGRAAMGGLAGGLNALSPGAGNGIMMGMNQWSPMNMAHMGLYNAEAIAALARGDNSHAQSEHSRELTRWVGPQAMSNIGADNARAFNSTQEGLLHGVQINNVNSEIGRRDALLPGELNNQTLTGDKLGAETRAENLRGDNYFSEMSHRSAMEPFQIDREIAGSYNDFASGEKHYGDLSLVPDRRALMKSRTDLNDTNATMKLFGPVGGMKKGMPVSLGNSGYASPEEVAASWGTTAQPTPESDIYKDADWRMGNAINEGNPGVADKVFGIFQDAGNQYNTYRNNKGHQSLTFDEQQRLRKKYGR